ncbi:DUF1624 domain-containing protein [Candidatus Peregrinibacteria bacterium]|nr:DUF1624 domain-containing protein [Candidatus Peregrinibacteria bacterium]
MNKAAANRYCELDLLRTISIAMMIAYHIAYDLESYYGWHIGLFVYAGWHLLQLSTATFFLLLAGCSFAISWSRTPIYRKYLKRGMGVVACGMLVTAATYWFEPATYVRFGILHMIGVSIILLPFFTRLDEWNLPAGLFIAGLGMFMPAVSGGTLALVPFGMTPPGFATVDYFPLIPWFGVVLIGYAIGLRIYVKRSPPLFSILHSSFFIRITWPGRHALIIYLLHQPVLLGILVALGAIGLF